MSAATPMPDMPARRIDAVVTAFAELLHAPSLAVICRLRRGGHVIGVNTYTDDPMAAMLAVWACNDPITTAEAHPTAPLTADEEDHA